MANRLDLEQQLLSCWHVVDDLKLFNKRVLNSDKLDIDELSNLLLGITSLYELKFSETFQTFEECVKNKEL